MNVKSIDIARALGISKSTVSLALNGKPGVSEQTRQEVLACKKQLEEHGVVPPGMFSRQPEQRKRQQIKIVKITNGMKNIQGAELDLWTDVNQVFEKNLQANGYSLGLLYADFREEDQSRMIAECNADDVAGVIIFGTELKQENSPLLDGIRKPLVIYDAAPDIEKYPVILIDNRQGVELAVNELLAKGNTDIQYLCNPLPMYNYLSRRRGFQEIMKQKGLGDASDRIIMGTIMAMHELNIRIPEDVSLIGIDALPSFLTGGIDMTSIRVPHTERAYWAIQLLLKEIEHPVKEKCKLYTNCVFVDGETVKKR